MSSSKVRIVSPEPVDRGGEAAGNPADAGSSTSIRSIRSREHRSTTEGISATTSAVRGSRCTDRSLRRRRPDGGSATGYVCPLACWTPRRDDPATGVMSPGDSPWCSRTAPSATGTGSRYGPSPGGTPSMGRRRRPRPHHSSSSASSQRRSPSSRSASKVIRPSCARIPLRSSRARTPSLARVSTISAPSAPPGVRPSRARSSTRSRSRSRAGDRSREARWWRDLGRARTRSSNRLADPKNMCPDTRRICTSSAWAGGALLARAVHVAVVHVAELGLVHEVDLTVVDGEQHHREGRSRRRSGMNPRSTTASRISQTTACSIPDSVPAAVPEPADDVRQSQVDQDPTDDRPREEAKEPGAEEQRSQRNHGGEPCALGVDVRASCGWT